MLPTVLTAADLQRWQAFVRRPRLAEPLPVLVERSLQIAWDFLGGTGEIADQQQTAEFLLRSIQSQILGGERRALMLSNRAIKDYRQQPIRLVAARS
jgi:hypothetical protein